MECSGENAYKVIEYSGQCENITLNKGIYLLEAWGAQGGNFTTDSSKGGYSRGVYRCLTPTTLTVCVGGRGTEATNSNNNEGGFNGGGISSFSENFRYDIYRCGTGGGMTSFQQSIDKTYLLIAGGGGGSTYFKNEDTNYYGGYGGGSSGGNGEGESGLGGAGGTVSQGGLGGKYISISNKYEDCNGRSGSQGKGGDGNTTAQACPGGGGGGYYGGGGGADTGPGGGGSGFFASYLRSAKLYGGNETFNNPYSVEENGHGGDGFAKITFLNHITPSYTINFRSFSCFVCILSMHSK